MAIANINKKRVAFFGHFDGSNFGNESSLWAMLHHVRRLYPDATPVCICSGPEVTARTYCVEAIPLSDALLTSWVPRNPVSKVLRTLFGSLIIEPYRWIKAFSQLRGMDMLIVPGTGLLSDAYGLMSWGPYGLFKWSIIAKLCRCELAVVSVGAGPLHSTLGRYFIKAVLSLADYKSYRDEFSVEFLKSIGVKADSSQVYPDLAFGLPEESIPRPNRGPGRGPTVGVGVMEYPTNYGSAGAREGIYSNYLQCLARLVEWLLSKGYDVRLLSGDLSDTPARQALKDLLQTRLSPAEQARIIDEPVHSVGDVLNQLASTDMVVATRFHNILFSFLCSRPVISLAFHHKCASLMNAMGMSEYCLDIGILNSDELIRKFNDMEREAKVIELTIQKHAKQYRQDLDQQYTLMFGHQVHGAQVKFPVLSESAVSNPVGAVDARR